jgi:hypothetical protein
MKSTLLVIFFFSFYFMSSRVAAQVPAAGKDTIAAKPAGKAIQKFNPRTATIRSAIFPGLGQIYNKKYWKLPLVYGALGTTAGVYFYNVKNYRLLRQAVGYLSDTIPGNDGQVDPQFKNLSLNAIRSYRNSFRQNVDYSVLFFIFFWGLNVVDATVDAHLKAFDVNDNLSLELKPGYSPLSNTTGISLVLNIGKKNYGK